MSKIILVGETNPYGAEPYYALYPAPDGCAGHRLCCRILGMHRHVYLQTFDRANLCEGNWSLRDARKKAVELLRGGGKFILLGSKVCAGFGVPFVPFVVQDEVLLKLPHPSGLCRLWHEAGSMQRARDLVGTFAPELAPLLGVL